MAHHVLLQMGPNSTRGWKQHSHHNERRKEKQLRENQPIRCSPELPFKGLRPHKRHNHSNKANTRREQDWRNAEELDAPNEQAMEVFREMSSVHSDQF
jgi:hypothetical protein